MIKEKIFLIVKLLLPFQFCNKSNQLKNAFNKISAYLFLNNLLWGKKFFRMLQLMSYLEIWRNTASCCTVNLDMTCIIACLNTFTVFHLIIENVLHVVLFGPKMNDQESRCDFYILLILKGTYSSYQKIDVQYNHFNISYLYLELFKDVKYLHNAKWIPIFTNINK